MRQKVLLFAILSAAALLLLALLRPRNGPAARETASTPDSPPVAPGTSPADSPSPAVPAPRPEPYAATMTPPETATGDQSTPDSPAAKQEASVDARVTELSDLGMDDAPASLGTILSELNNRDPRIREAAVEAAVQFGSPEAIPNLMDAAAQTDDPKEKARIMEAVEFLKLPTLTEVLAEKKP